MEKEEEIVMMMISSTTRSSSTSGCPDKASNSSLSHDQRPITSSNWKLYHNPFYYNKQPHHHRGNNTRFPHRPHRPLPFARKIGASFWDLAFFRPASTMMEQPGKEDVMAARVDELRTELERERRARLKLEHINKKLVKELGEERSGREALERVCKKLAKEISCDKASIDRMKREIEEERETLGMAEAMRKENLQMKLAEAKVLLREKISNLDHEAITDIAKEEEEEGPKRVLHRSNFMTALTASKPARKPTDRLALVEKLPSWSLDNAVGANSDRSKAATAVHRRLSLSPSPSPEPENPHIKRGINGSVEFQRVVRAIGSKGQTLGSKKIECQKAHIQTLLKHSSAIRSTDKNLIQGS